MSDRPQFLEVRKPAVTGQDDFIKMLDHDRASILESLIAKGAVYFPQTPLQDEADFKRAVLAFNKNIAEYTGAKVRQNQGDRLVYSPTSTPKDRINYLHHEMGYQKFVPEGLAFFCKKPSPVGGESLLADSRQWYNEINPDIRAELEERQLLFQRVLFNRTRLQSYLAGNFDLFALTPSWQSNFECTDSDTAEAKATAIGHQVTWTKEGHMLLSTKISPVRQHPQSKEKMWVNNAHLFQLHKQVYGSRLYYLFKSYFLVTGKPMTTCLFGDGRPIPAEFTSEILRASLQVQNSFRLNERDLILINNHTVAHGRLPFDGPRKILFAMYENLF